jgi:aspartate aminotransferase
MSLTTSTLPLAERIDYFAESQTLAMAKKARELAAQGHQVINLSLGEPDFKTPKHICEAAKKAIDDGFHGYTPVAGNLDLRQAIAAKLKRDNGIETTPEQIVVSTGAKQSIANVIQAMINPGDEVIVFAPYWVSYVAIIQLAQGVPVIVDGAIENEFKVTAEQLEAAITPRTKAFIFSSPCNPTGAVWTKEELTAIAKVMERNRHVYAISDEIYEYINYTGSYTSLGSFPAISEQVITINGFAKGFAMTGWRVGYMSGPKWLAAACDKLQGQFTSGTCSIAQKAALAGLTESLEPTFAMRDAFLKRRDIAIQLLKAIPNVKTPTPAGAFYLFPDMSHYFGKKFGSQTIANADDLCMLLLNEAKVSSVPGDAFGNPNCVRFSYAASEESIQKAFTSIKDVLAQMQ